MQDYDVILGMDFLEKYYTNLECHTRMIVFKPPGEKEFEYFGDHRTESRRIISSLEAERLLRSGCVYYLENVEDTSQESKLTLKDVPVVRNFVEVFPKDLPRYLHIKR